MAYGYKKKGYGKKKSYGKKKYGRRPKHGTKTIITKYRW